MSLIEQQIKDVEKFFDGYAKDFDSIYGHGRNRSFWEKITDNLFRKTMQQRMAITLQNTEKNEIRSVLDIGCGPGHYVVGFLNQGKKVVALDIAEGMMNICKNLISKSNIPNKDVTFVKSDYFNFKPTEKIDAACMMGFIEYIPNPSDLLKKLCTEINKEIYISFPKKGGLLGIQRKIRYNLRNCPLWMYSKEMIMDVMAKANIDKNKVEIIDCSRDYFVKIII